ncbi:MAG: CheR family methyltransferase [Bacteroidales bacterium]
MARKRDNEQPVIAAIGASANGIKAMEAFFSNLGESTGIAFVIIQHLSPDYKSILPEILQKKTGLKVLDVENNTTPSPGHVYVLPAGFDVTISNNRFHLQKYSKDKRGLHLPIDLFLRSLAADYKDRTAAILLSGSGSDGTAGIREIKSAGGLVMVQDPESAKFSSMPRNAIETGLVDKVARPEDLPGMLIEFQKNINKEDKPFDEDDSPDSLKRLFQLLKAETDHDFSGYKKNTVFRRIRRRMTLHKIKRLKDYVNFIEDNPDEVHHLFKELLILVTSFFRNREAFDILREKVFPEIFNPDNPDPVRIWVAACATGEEVYSIAILAKEYQESQHIRVDMQIFATDVDSQALEIARTAKYKGNIESDIPGELLDKYFQKTDDLYQVHKDIRDMVTFAEHNAIKDPPYSKLDLISCRNFLIYLEPPVQKNLLNAFHYALQVERYLFLGSSETPSLKEELFDSMDAKAHIYRKKKNRKAVVDYLSQKREKETQWGIAGAREKPGREKLSVKEFAENEALKEYMHPFLLIDKNGDIQYSLGRCDKYFRFQVGEPSQNIVTLAREGLQIPITSALRKIKSENKSVAFKNIKISDSGNNDYVSLALTPVKRPSQFDHLIIVTVLPSKSVPTNKEYKREDVQISGEYEEYMRQMELELQENREYLNSIIEELETSNEELISANEEAQSTNEELQSTNEELETSKEEMQSLNEELETSNNELQRKIDEVTTINNDLNNFLQSTDIGILFLDKSLKIRRFSPQIKSIVNLVESDIGRSINDFGIKFLQEQLVQDVKEVLEKLVKVEKEVSRGENEIYWMRISPYRTIEDQVDGVVITFTDITEKQKVQKLIEESERWKKYRELFHHMEHGFALFGAVRDKKGDVDDFRLIETNHAFEDLLQIDPDKDKDKKVSELFSEKGYRHAFMVAGKKALAGKAYRDERYFAKSKRHFNILYFSHEEDVVATFLQDITREKEEMKADMHLASIVESSDDAIFSESPEGEILSWNEGAVQLYGYTEEEATGSGAGELYAYPRDDGDMAVIREVRKGKKIKNFETFHRRKDGSVGPVSVTKSPIKDDTGKVIAISNIVKDITGIKKREKELINAKEAAEQASMLKNMFLANMSHEIRTPLNSILGFTSILKEKVSNEQDKRCVDNISDSGKQLLHLIDDIVDVSRLDAGELMIHPASVNIDELLKKIKEQFEGYIIEKNVRNIDFRLKLPDGNGKRCVITDEFRLRQIFQNLLSNAFKYTEKGYIEFGYEIRDKKDLLFYASDTSAGISPGYHEKIFERFRQADSYNRKRDKVIRGTGLGLAIARGLTEQLGGEIWVDSIEGKGSTFYFTIPFEEGKAEKSTRKQKKEKSAQTPEFTGKKVIIAEDDPYSLEMLKFMLKATGIEMFAAEDGEEVMDLFNNEKVDIVLLDIRMPKKDGYELIREIRSKDPDIPVIAQTAFAMPEQIKASREMGFDEHLVKPVSKESLYAVLEKYLG